MSMAEMLDYAIKRHEGGCGEYITRDGRKYERYIDNTSWEKFVKEMREHYPMAYCQFEKGSGKELSTKDRYGKPCAPKMGCYGSSSRMMYLLSRHVKNFAFERKLPTRVGGTANLDGWLEKEDSHIFVEAKCREPYLPKGNVSLTYAGIYSYLSQNTELKIEMTPYKNEMKVRFFWQGREITHFDVKQMICHLLGIANGLLKGEISRKKIDFLYLIYDPSRLGVEMKLIDAYKKTIDEGKRIDFVKIFYTVAEFLTTEYGIKGDIPKDMFSFTVCSQKDYKQRI